MKKMEWKKVKAQAYGTLAGRDDAGYGYAQSGTTSKAIISKIMG